MKYEYREVKLQPDVGIPIQLNVYGAVGWMLCGQPYFTGHGTMALMMRVKDD